MSKDFQQTVDLKSKLRPRKKERPERATPKLKSRAKDIDRIYGGGEEETEENNFKRINQPIHKQPNNLNVNFIIYVLIAILVIAGFYFIFIRDVSKESSTPELSGDIGWYAVKLLNNEIYYGQISDIKSDPIIIKNVYYNYDQINGDSETKNESGNLRLVKRGQEAHGPSGTMDIVRSQVVFMEPLKEESKVLKAILDYEN